MSKYNTIREQLRVEADKKYQSTIHTYLIDIESRNMQDEFCDQYVKLLDVGFHPYDCLLAFMKGVK
jgi:hypothetical protein|tara:strand:- start:1113 stop:1310 length:198 start_codon:yes stop_codon:yes gene_type:complete